MEKLKKLRPLILTVLIVLADQLSKSWIVRNVPLNDIYKKYFGDFIWIVHVRNTGAAFSLGADASTPFRIVFLVVLCLVLMLGLGYAILSEKRKFLTPFQRWIFAGILGGGLGTMVDRIFRFKDGVVDFISVNMYGFLGMDRFATFNVADSCVVCFVILFIISEIVNSIKEKKTKNEDSVGTV